MKKYYLTVLLSVILSAISYSQEVEGKVYEKDPQGKNIALPGVNVFVLNTTNGTVTGPDGSFKLHVHEGFPISMVFSFIGFRSDTIELKSASKNLAIVLKPSVSLGTVEITGKKESTSYSSITAINTQVITSGELKKAACCNLSESFETNATVDVNYADAVSGAKQIQVMGIDGIYTQINNENLPLIRGLMSGYGLSFIPGTWLESIQVTKGTGSVTTGYESMAGMINLELLKPEKEKPLFLNFYAGERGRFEGNIHTAKKINERWSTIAMLHGSTLQRKNDQDFNGFLDFPRYNQVNGYNRWKYMNEKVAIQFGVRAFDETRYGGHIHYDFNKPNDSSITRLPFFSSYGIKIHNRQIEGFSKAALLFPASPYRGLALITSVRRHELNSFFGVRNLNADEKMAALNLVYQDMIKNSDHKYKVGLSYLYDDLDQRFFKRDFSRKESVPGMYAEYIFERHGLMSATAGIRTDYHNLFGLFYTPRLHVKFDLSEFSFLRLSAGKGYRVPNIFADYPALPASSRSIIIKDPIAPEISWNYGASFNHEFHFGGKKVQLNLDYFYNYFVNQYLLDMDLDQHAVYFYNSKGSYSHSFQSEVVHSPFRGLELKAAYKRYDVMNNYLTGYRQKPFTSNDRFFFNVGYTTPFEKYSFDYTVQWYGSKRIPFAKMSHEIEEPMLASDPYVLMNAQITRRFKLWEMYLGAENLTNFIQMDMIRMPEKPYSNEFDATMIWGPAMGRNIYAGLRTKF